MSGLTVCRERLCNGGVIVGIVLILALTGAAIGGEAGAGGDERPVREGRAGWFPEDAEVSPLPSRVSGARLSRLAGERSRGISAPPAAYGPDHALGRREEERRIWDVDVVAQTEGHAVWAVVVPYDTPHILPSSAVHYYVQPADADEAEYVYTDGPRLRGGGTSGRVTVTALEDGRLMWVDGGGRVIFAAPGEEPAQPEPGLAGTAGAAWSDGILFHRRRLGEDRSWSGSWYWMPIANGRLDHANVREVGALADAGRPHLAWAVRLDDLIVWDDHPYVRSFDLASGERRIADAPGPRRPGDQSFAADAEFAVYGDDVYRLADGVRIRTVDRADWPGHTYHLAVREGMLYSFHFSREDGTVRLARVNLREDDAQPRTLLTMAANDAFTDRHPGRRWDWRATPAVLSEGIRILEGEAWQLVPW